MLRYVCVLFVVEHRKWWGNRHLIPVQATFRQEFTMQDDWNWSEEIGRKAWRNRMWRKRSVGSWQTVVNWLQWVRVRRRMMRTCWQPASTSACRIAGVLGLFVRRRHRGEDSQVIIHHGFWGTVPIIILLSWGTFVDLVIVIFPDKEVTAVLHIEQWRVKIYIRCERHYCNVHISVFVIPLLFLILENAKKNLSL